MQSKSYRHELVLRSMLEDLGKAQTLFSVQDIVCARELVGALANLGVQTLQAIDWRCGHRKRHFCEYVPKRDKATYGAATCGAESHDTREFRLSARGDGACIW